MTQMPIPPLCKKLARPVSFNWLMYYNVFRLEQEYVFYCNMKYFDDQVQAGEWDDVERYLCGWRQSLLNEDILWVKETKVPWGSR